MKKNNGINLIRSIALGLGALALISCSWHSTIVKMQEVKEVPSDQYERIIKLNNPAAAPNKTLAGLVFIRKGANVCTDYPREEIITTLDELTMMEKHLYRYYTNYAIEEGGKTFGFVSIPLDYRVILWKSEEDENCKYKVQIIWLDKESGDVSDSRNVVGPGGGHHGP